jgi:hypothetical protein
MAASTAMARLTPKARRGWRLPLAGEWAVSSSMVSWFLPGE